MLLVLMVMHVADKYNLFIYRRKIQAIWRNLKFPSYLRGDRQVLEWTKAQNLLTWQRWMVLPISLPTGLGLVLKFERFVRVVQTQWSLYVCATVKEEKGKSQKQFRLSVVHNYTPGLGGCDRQVNSLLPRQNNISYSSTSFTCRGGRGRAWIREDKFYIQR